MPLPCRERGVKGEKQNKEEEKKGEKKRKKARKGMSRDPGRKKRHRSSHTKEKRTTATGNSQGPKGGTLRMKRMGNSGGR